MGSKSRKLKRSRGQTLVMLTLALVPMFGMIGMVSDFGYMHFVKMSAQTAAEAAAQAAIIEFHASVSGTNFSCSTTVVCASTPTACPASITTPANSIQRGCMYAAQHGFQSTGNQLVTYQTGTGSTPPTAPGSGTAAYWVTFRVVQRVPQMFSAILGYPNGLVAARSTAMLMGASDCIYALNPTQSGAFQVGGTANLTSSCGIYVNSNDPSALGTNGGGSVSAPEYDVVGGANTHYNLTPNPNTGAPPTSDPLANLAAPATAPYHCDHINYSAGNWTNPTLSPGVYCGGIDVGNNTYTLSPGNYILVGGGLHTQSSNSTINGTGVMIYNTLGATDTSGTFSYSPINIAANSNVSLIAPTTGTYAGILFFEDRSAPASSDTYGGGSTAVYQGTIYARNAAVTMYGNSSVNTQYTMLVADTISMVGTTAFNNNYSSLLGGSPIQRIALLE